MQTPTHVIVAAALLARPGDRRRNWWAIAGSLIPDLSIYIFFAWAYLIERMPMREIWSVAYWAEPWQTFGAISNSIPLALGLLAVGCWRRWAGLTVVSLAILSHLALDFPVHADDAHQHFWPFTSWRFFSPISYWDPAHHGAVGQLIDCAIAVAASVVVWLRFRNRLTATVLGLTIAVLIVRITMEIIHAR